MSTPSEAELNDFSDTRGDKPATALFPTRLRGSCNALILLLFSALNAHAAGVSVKTDIGIKTVFDTPVEYCFSQNSGSVKDITKVEITRHFFVDIKDIQKNGDVFLGFFSRKTGELWLYGGKNYPLGPWGWSKVEPNQPLAVYRSGKLEYITQVNSGPPVNLSEYRDDAELYVGYGVREKSDATLADSFQNMMDNQRFSEIWRVGADFNSGDLICLKALEVNQIRLTYPASQ
jgi:hypothetical protein